MNQVHDQMTRNDERITRLIEECIDSFDLSLDGLSVYTEAATGSYAVTAPIAAAAGADRVFAIADDSRFGSARRAFEETDAIAEALSQSERIRYVRNHRHEFIAESDIVTNTGFVRPIDRDFVAQMDPKAAVPLMYEPWEYRGEVDLTACWNSGIPVVGTDESDERIETQEYVGLLAVELSFQRNIEVMHGRYIVLGGGEMARYTHEKLVALGAESQLVNPRSEGDDETSIDVSSVDAIVVVDNGTERQLVGPDGLFRPSELADAEPGIELLHVCGPVHYRAIENCSIPCTPSPPAPVGQMSVTAGEIGPRPVVELHTAGLSVGAAAARARQHRADLDGAVEAAVTDTVGSDFSDELKAEHDHPDFGE